MSVRVCLAEHESADRYFKQACVERKAGPADLEHRDGSAKPQHIRFLKITCHRLHSVKQVAT